MQESPTQTMLTRSPLRPLQRRWARVSHNRRAFIIAAGISVVTFITLSHIVFTFMEDPIDDTLTHSQTPARRNANTTEGASDDGIKTQFPRSGSSIPLLIHQTWKTTYVYLCVRLCKLVNNYVFVLIHVQSIGDTRVCLCVCKTQYMCIPVCMHNTIHVYSCMYANSSRKK